MNNHSTAKITDLIYFHEMTLPVITCEDIKYIPAKPIVDAMGLDWRSAKKSILEEENAFLYGTTWVKVPKFVGLGGTSTPSEEETLCFQLEHARSYIMRVNIRMMKAKGSLEAAKKIQALQKEWSTAIYNYETHGIAIKGKSTHNELMQIMKMRQMAIGQEKQVFSEMLQSKLAELGYQADDQGDLFK